MAYNFDAGKDFMAEMHVLQAVRWAISVWENDVTKPTIQNCWARSQCYDMGQFPRVNNGIHVDVDGSGDAWKDSRDNIEELTKALYNLRHQGALEDIGSVLDFVNPQDEQIVDEPEVITQSIADAYNPELDPESGDDEPIDPCVSLAEALNALHQLRRYEEQQEQSDNFKSSILLQELRTYERELSRRNFEARSTNQGDIRSFLAKHDELVIPSSL
jgi:hypothetical protein